MESPIDFTVKDIDDAALATAVDKEMNNEQFRKYVEDMTQIIQNEPEEGRILDWDLQQYVNKDNYDRLEAPGIPQEAEASQPIDDYQLTELELRRNLAMFFTLAKEYKRLSGHNFSTKGFKGDSSPVTQPNSYGNTSGGEMVAEPNDMNGMAVDKDTLSAIDDKLHRLVDDIRPLMSMFEEKKMKRNTEPLVGNN